MDTHFIKTEGKELLILKVSGSLYLDGHDGDDIRVQVRPRELKVIKDDDNILRITCYTSCSISIPKNLKTRVEKVGGSCVIQDISCENFYVQRVGGSLSVQEVDNLELSRVGGSCQIKNVQGDVKAERVSGDLYIFWVGGEVQVNTARSDAIIMMVRKAVTASSQGDMVVQYIDAEIQPMNLRSKGNITLLLPKHANANLDATFSGWDIVLTMNGSTNNYGGGHYDAVLGEGGPALVVYASGDIVVSDEHQGIVKEVQDENGSDWFVDFDAFDLKYDETDAYDRRIQRAMGRLEKKLSKAEGKFDVASRKMVEEKASIADRIEERAMRRAERAEKLAEVKIQKRTYMEGIEALKQAQEQLKDLKLPIHIPLDFISDIEIPEVPVVDLRGFKEYLDPDAPAAPKAPPEPKASREERMMILEMVKAGQISIDQAEKLLSALNE